MSNGFHLSLVSYWTLTPRAGVLNLTHRRSGLLPCRTLNALHHGQVKAFAAPFQIGVVADRSLVSETLLKREPLSSHSYSVRTSQPIVDKQLARYLGREGIACIPLVFQRQRFGIIVAGMDACQLEVFEKHMDLLQDFGELVAATLLHGPSNELWKDQ